MFYRNIWQKLEPELARDEILVITGPRQVGKTTTLKWLLSKVPSENKLYLDLEVLSNRALFEKENYDDVIKSLSLMGLNTTEKLYIALDEIQTVPNLPSVVKYLYDHYSVKFLLSGSSSYYLKNHFTESMAGRKVLYEMYPLSFSEFLQFKNVRPPEQKNFEEVLGQVELAYPLFQSYYDEYIEFGGMLKVVLEESTERKKQILQEIYSSYIKLDVEALADFNSSREFRILVELLASRVGNKLDITKLSQTMGISRPTVYSYLEFLEQTYIIRTIDVLSNSADVRNRAQKKVYFVDTGIANINADISFGAKFENTICHQLALKGNVSHYSDASSEVDFILDKNVGFEVKVTPVESDHKKMMDVLSKLEIDTGYLVGARYFGAYSNFLYGALL